MTFSKDDTDAVPGGVAGDLLGSTHWLESIHGHFVGQATTGMAGFTNRAVRLCAGAIETLDPERCLQEMHAGSSVSRFSLHPLPGMGWIVCDADLVFAVVEALFGGAGKRPARTGDRGCSPTEQRVIGRLVTVILADYSRAWQDVYPVEMRCLHTGRPPSLTEVAGEPVARTVFRVEVGESESVGALQIILPRAALDLVREALHRPPVDPVPAAVEVPLVAELARVPVTEAQLMAMRVGDVMALAPGPLIQATVEGVPVIEAGYGAANGHHALRVARVMNAPEAGRHLPAGSRWLTVELGRVHLPRQRVHDLAHGSVLELDTPAGGPMAVRVEGHLVARGEGVLADGRFGLRLTDIAVPAERVCDLSCGH